MSSPPVYPPVQPPAGQTPPPGLKPYLELPHLLSLIWMSYPIISLVFVIFRLQVSSATAQDTVASLKEAILASCKAAETAATSTASIPRYMAIKTNQEIISAVNSTLNVSRLALIDSLTILEALLNFFVDMYRSTFLCFIELVVRGTLSLLIAAVAEISNSVTTVVGGVRTAIQSSVDGANSALQSLVSGINGVNPFNKITAPTFSVPSLSRLQNVTIPSDFENTLIQLNNSMPTATDIKNALNVIMDTPFELVKKMINDTLLGVVFDESLLTLPNQNTVSFCNQVDTSVIDNLGKDFLKIAELGTFIVIGAIGLLLLFNALLQWYKSFCLKGHLDKIRQAWGNMSLSMSDHNLLVLGGLSIHPFLTRIANMIAALFRLSPAKLAALQWFFHYIFHPSALACLLIGTMGLASIQLQLLAIRSLSGKYSAQAAGGAASFSDLIFTAVNDSMYNQSSAYANNVNGHVNTIQTTINNGVFFWVNSTMSTLNSSVESLYTDVNTFVTNIFGNTILGPPMQEFVRCIIGSKVQAIEQAVTFLHDNLQINLPTMNDSVLVLSQATINETTHPIAQAALGSGTNGTNSGGGYVDTVLNAYIRSLEKEQWMFIIFIGLWGLVVLMAFATLMWHAFKKKPLSLGGPMVVEENSQDHQFAAAPYFASAPYVAAAPHFDAAPPFAAAQEHYNMPPAPDFIMEKGFADLPSFTPMPSPSPYSEKDSKFMKPPQHPLRALKPNFERSWDSFIDYRSPT